MKLAFVAGLFVGFGFGLPCGGLTERFFQHGPWIKPGENRVETVDRIEAKLNEVCGKGKRLRYKVFSAHDYCGRYPYADKSGFYRIVSESDDLRAKYLDSAEGIMREVDRQEMGK